MTTNDSALAMIEAILENRPFSDWPGLAPGGWQAWFSYAARGEW